MSVAFANPTEAADRRERGLQAAMASAEKQAKEANQMAVELEADVSYLVKMVPRRGKLGGEGEAGAGAGGDVGVLVRGGADAEGERKTLALWTMHTFTERLNNMRAKYQDYLAGGKDLAAWRKRLGAASTEVFVGKNEPTLIGSGTIYLNPLHYLVNIEQTTPLLDYTGHCQGAIQARIRLSIPGQDEEKGDASPEEPLLEHFQGKALNIVVELVSVSGLPADVSKDVHVRYSWYGDGGCETAHVDAHGGCANIAHERAFDHTVGHDILDFIHHDVLQLEVYGLSTTVVDGQHVASSGAHTIRRGLTLKDLKAFTKRDSDKREEATGQAHEARTSAAEEETASLRAKVKDMDAVMARRSEELSALQGKLMELRESPAVAQSDSGEETVKKDAYDQLVNDTKLVQSQLQEEISALQSKAGASQQEVDTIREQYASAQADLAAAQGAGGNAQKERQVQVADLKAKVKEAETKLGAAEAKQKTCVPESDLRGAETKLAALQTELEELRKQKNKSSACAIL